ncbi:MAG: hypothetical protein JOZ83_15625 [Silvibacterium sp.]|nr:hypothetical protein [Silvibacterium sp.]
MNSAGKIAAVLLVFGIAGCKHKVQTAALPSAPEKTVYTPEDVAKQESLPQPPQPGQVEVKAPGSDVAQQKPAPKPTRASRRKPKPIESGAAQPAKETTGAAAGVEEASSAKAPDQSPIGQLTSGSEGSSTHNRQQIQDQITNIENGLTGIKRTLTSDEQQTATQIRTFLTKARKALDQDDLDGANTLVTKAKVLLEELTKG